MRITRRASIVPTILICTAAAFADVPHGDAAHGQMIYSSRCGGCHSLHDNGAGPRHEGLFGRIAGTQPGFNYSDALKHSGIVWNEATLQRWLADPTALVPGNKMVVQLVPEAQDRADVITYLKQATAVR